MDELRLRLSDVNPYITCSLCEGYFINAATITECMHTFCKSCLLLYIKVASTCPICAGNIHPSQPLKSIRFDQTMQEIVYKLVPGLRENERLRENDFNEKAGLPTEHKEEFTTDANKSEADYVKRNYANGIRIADHQHICMESVSDEIPSLERKFMLVPRRSTILHLKKYVASNILSDPDKWDFIDIYCNGEIQGKEHSVEFVYATCWRRKSPILVFQYSLEFRDDRRRTM